MKHHAGLPNWDAIKAPPIQTGEERALDVMLRARSREIQKACLVLDSEYSGRKFPQDVVKLWDKLAVESSCIRTLMDIRRLDK